MNDDLPAVLQSLERDRRIGEYRLNFEPHDYEQTREVLVDLKALMAGQLPATLAEAEEMARQNNPRVHYVGPRKTNLTAVAKRRARNKAARKARRRSR